MFTPKKLGRSNAAPPQATEAQKHNLNIELLVSPVLRDYISPLTESEEAILRESIREEGVREPLVVWTIMDAELEIITEDGELRTSKPGDKVILDGHHRYRLAKEVGADYRLAPDKTFDSLAEAQEYMLQLQLGRRNLNNNQSAYYIGSKYNFNVQGIGGNKSQGGKTKTILADEFGKGERTILNFSKLAKVIDECSSAFKVSFLKGDFSIKKDTYLEVAKNIDNLSQEEIENLLQEPLQEDANSTGEEQPKPADRAPINRPKILTYKSLKSSIDKLSEMDLKRDLSDDEKKVIKENIDALIRKIGL
ncbi:hypothetical protein [Flammeovirga aprica]|uniref:ParB/Sulfiredoxin domain-containing protein n=1 Tax=Flammeovirga aprica JL-4 TaxID=694437 RepID=A0A7X9RXL6_9BACT|nr:hypothetical protein [Flammeovirga aprica]NME70550.1 hypothetical protein [Flammeovirga aprica JL-4]